MLNLIKRPDTTALQFFLKSVAELNRTPALPKMSAAARASLVISLENDHLKHSNSRSRYTRGSIGGCYAISNVDSEANQTILATNRYSTNQNPRKNSDGLIYHQNSTLDTVQDELNRLYPHPLNPSNSLDFNDSRVMENTFNHNSFMPSPSLSSANSYEAFDTIRSEKVLSTPPADDSIVLPPSMDPIGKQHLFVIIFFSYQRH